MSIAAGDTSQASSAHSRYYTDYLENAQEPPPTSSAGDLILLKTNNPLRINTNVLIFMGHWLSIVTCDVSQCMEGNGDLKSRGDPVLYVYIHGIPCLRPAQFTLALNIHMGSMSTRIIPSTFILCPCPVPQHGSVPLGQLKGLVDSSLHPQLGR